MKKIIIGILTFALLFATLATATGCSKIVKLQVEVVVYNTETKTTEEKTISFDMYEGLAPNAVAAVKQAIKDGKYSDCVLYEQSTSNGVSTSSQLMFGGLKKSGSTFERVQQTAVPNADFEKNGTTGSNLTNSLGYLGLWRTWDTTKSFTNNGFTNSTTQIYMPKSDLTSYNGYFCIFAKYTSQDDLDVINDIISLFGSTDYYTEYTCYFEADRDGRLVKDADGNPVWNIMTTEEFDEATENSTVSVYSSADDPDNENSTKIDTQYDKYTVKIVNSDKLDIKSFQVK